MTLGYNCSRTVGISRQKEEPGKTPHLKLRKNCARNCQPLIARKPMSRTDDMHVTNRNAQLRRVGGARLPCRRFHFLCAAMVALLCLALATRLRADTISGTVKDPSGAVVAGARVEISGGNLTQPIVLTSDESGKFAAPNLTPGNYSVRVSKDGFDDVVKAVE